MNGEATGVTVPEIGRLEAKQKIRAFEKRTGVSSKYDRMIKIERPI